MITRNLPNDLIDNTLDLTTQPETVTCETVMEITPKRLEFLEGIRQVIAQTEESPSSELQQITDIVGIFFKEDARDNQTRKH